MCWVVIGNGCVVISVGGDVLLGVEMRWWISMKG